MRDRGILMKSDFRIRNLAFSDRSSKSFVAVITIDYFFFLLKMYCAAAPGGVTKELDTDDYQ